MTRIWRARASVPRELLETASFLPKRTDQIEAAHEPRGEASPKDGSGCDRDGQERTPSTPPVGSICCSGAGGSLGKQAAAGDARCRREGQYQRFRQAGKEQADSRRGNWRRMRRVLCAPQSLANRDLTTLAHWALARQEIGRRLTQLIRRTNPTAPNSKNERLADRCRPRFFAERKSGARSMPPVPDTPPDNCFFQRFQPPHRGCPCAAAAIERPGFRARDGPLDSADGKPRCGKAENGRPAKPAPNHSFHISASSLVVIPDREKPRGITPTT